MLDFAWVASPDGWAALVTLTAMEIVLGIDNVVFISVMIARLPDAQAKTVRTIGLALAFVFRIAMLFALTTLMSLKTPVLTILGRGLSWRDIILIVGGLFLIWKATVELHHALEGPRERGEPKIVPQAMTMAIVQVTLIDLVFSVDSILTAIGMAKDLTIMILAVMISMSVMYLASGGVAGFIKRHPTAKVLALAFLILIGVSLAAEGWHFEIPRGYIYSAMGFATLVEALNIWAKRNRRRAAAESVATKHDRAAE